MLYIIQFDKQIRSLTLGYAKREYYPFIIIFLGQIYLTQEFILIHNNCGTL